MGHVALFAGRRRQWQPLWCAAAAAQRESACALCSGSLPPPPPPAAADAIWFDGSILPLLFFFTPAGATSFALAYTGSLGPNTLDPVGHASPVVREGVLAEEEMYMATNEGVTGFSAGAACPVGPSYYSAGFSAECSGLGDCNCALGLCDCSKLSACFQGGGGSCGDTCNRHGKCTATGPLGLAGSASCACDAGWSGATCAVAVSPAPAFLSTPAGRAAVAVPIVAAAAGVAFWLYRTAKLGAGGIGGAMLPSGSVPLVEADAPIYRSSSSYGTAVVVDNPYKN